MLWFTIGIFKINNRYMVGKFKIDALPWLQESGRVCCSFIRSFVCKI